MSPEEQEKISPLAPVTVVGQGGFQGWGALCSIRKQKKGTAVERGERFYRIHRRLKAGKCLPLADLLDDLQISRATFKRDIEYLRDRYGAPLVYDKERRGYCYDLTIEGADRFDLPGLWFSASEIHALLVTQSLLSELGTGLLADQIEPLTARLEKLLADRRYAKSEIANRIRVLNVAARPTEPQHFGVAAQGLLQRRRLQLEHHNRATDEVTTREVSPQRLVHYRGTWYLDTWCHLRKALRSFSLDAVTSILIQDSGAKDIAARDLDAYLASSYGIFAGAPTGIAILRFSPIRSRWVQNEMWHPKQKGRMDELHRFVLEIPYGNDQELVMDILRHGADVEVLEPAILRKRVSDELRRAAEHYRQ